MKYHPVKTHVVHDATTNTVEYLTDSGLTLHPDANVVHTAECKKDAKD